MVKLIRSDALLVFCLLAALLVGPMACQDDATRAAEHFQRAEAYLASEDFDKAIIEYRNVLQISPKDAKAHYGLAKAYIGAKKLSDGYWWLSETVRLDPGNVDARMEYGEISRLGEKFDEALQQADAVIELQPNNADAYLLGARALIGLKRKDEARKYFEKAIEAAPNDSIHLARLASFLTGEGKRDEAEVLYKKAVEVDPNFVSLAAWAGFLGADPKRQDEAEAAYLAALEKAEPEELAKAYSMLGNFYYSRKKFDKAEAILLEGIKKAPESLDLVYLLARFYRMQGQQEKADSMMEAATKVKGDDVEPYLRLSLYRYQNGDFAGALAAAEQAIAVNPEDKTARLRKAELLIEKGYRDDAQEPIAEGRSIVDAVLAEDPGSVEAAYIKARLSLSEGDTASAVAGLRQVVEKRPDWAQAHFVLGMALGREEDLQGARVELARAVELDSSLTAARKLLARVHSQLGEYEFALEEGEKALAQDPDDNELRTFVAENLLRLKRLGQAEDLLLEVPVEKRDAQTWFALGKVAKAEKKIPESRKYLEKADSMKPGDPQILLMLLGLDRADGRLADSKKRIAAALEANPENGRLVYLRGMLEAFQGNADAAEKDLRRSIELDPENLSAYQALGSVISDPGRRKELIAVYEKGVAENPRFKENLYLAIGTLYEAEGNFDKAIENYELSLKENPNVVAAKNNLAFLISETGGDLDRALELAQSAKAGAPDDPNVADTLGWVLYKKGIASAAITYLQEAEAAMPEGSSSRPVVQYHLALAHEANGDTAQARAEVEKALETFAGYEKAFREKQGSLPPQPAWVAQARALQARLSGADAG